MEVLSRHSPTQAALIEDIPCMDIKQDSLLKLSDIKEEIPSLFLSAQYQPMKDFSSDDESELPLYFSESSDSDESDDSNKLNKSRRNRRKPLLPQKTVQSEVSQTGSAGTSSECSQDASESIMLNFADTLIESAADGDFLEFADGDDLLQDIDEENIFKGLQEEAGKVLFLLMYDNSKS